MAAPTDTHLLIAGCGYTGRQVAADANTAGYVSITGSASSTAGMARLEAAGIRACRIDLDEQAVVPSQPSPWALLYSIPPAGPEGRDTRLSRFLATLPAPLPARVVYLSTTGVYGDRQGRRVRETDAPLPSSDRARRRLHAESQLEAWCAENEVALCILRVPGIYGPGRLQLERIRAGAAVLRESDCGPGNRIHRDDLAACCLRALVAGSPTGVMNVCDDDHSSSTAFVMEVAKQTRLNPPPEISMSEARRQFSPMRLSFLQESRLVDNTRMHRDLGVQLKYPNMAAGIAASLAEDQS